MVDQHFDLKQKEARAELNSAIDSGLARFARGVMAAFETLHRISWRSPWAAREQARCN